MCYLQCVWIHYILMISPLLRYTFGKITEKRCLNCNQYNIGHKWWKLLMKAFHLDSK